MRWYVYMVRCADNTLYSGITTDVARRVNEHNTSDTKGAKYTRARRPVVLVYTKRAKDRSAAASKEAALKNLLKSEKEALIKSSLTSSNHFSRVSTTNSSLNGRK